MTELRIALNYGGLTFACRVLAVKTTYGRRRLQVTPVAGSGVVWVWASRVSPIPAAEPADPTAAAPDAPTVGAVGKEGKP